jgi:speckle-type POZ protein
VQWGPIGNECHPGADVSGQAFGPDVHPSHGSSGLPVPPLGIFGLSHEQLLESEWVVDDILTVKFELQVRKDVGYNEYESRPLPDLPASTISSDYLNLLDSGKLSDVTFIVQGESVKAHSLVLRARSEVFDRMLTCDMRESISKEIVIDDSDVVPFKVLLRFLYTDDFSCVDKAIASACSRGQSTKSDVDSTIDTSGNSKHQLRLPLIQGLLKLCHKYQILRLNLWCEHELRKHITVADVCSLLCQAHLYEAKQLEKMCLAFMLKNMKALMVTPEFGALCAEWPAVMLKISLHMADVSETSASPAIEAQRHTQLGKRKRDQ